MYSHNRNSWRKGAAYWYQKRLKEYTIFRDVDYTTAFAFIFPRIFILRSHDAGLFTFTANTLCE